MENGWTGSDANGFPRRKRRYERGMLVTSRRRAPCRNYTWPNIPRISSSSSSHAHTSNRLVPFSSRARARKCTGSAYVFRATGIFVRAGIRMVRGPTILEGGWCSSSPAGTLLIPRLILRDVRTLRVMTKVDRKWKRDNGTSPFKNKNLFSRKWYELLMVEGNM